MTELAASVLQNRIIRLSNQQGPKMQYMLMFYKNEAEITAQRYSADRTGPYWDAWNAYMGALYPTGIVRRGDALLPPSAATTVRLEGGNRLVQDGSGRLLRNSPKRQYEPRRVSRRLQFLREWSHDEASTTV